MLDDAAALGDDGNAGVNGDSALHAGADQRFLRTHRGNSLALHVGAHQGAVGVIVLKERDQGRSDGNDLLRRHVHELHVRGLAGHGIAVVAALHVLRDDLAVLVEIGVGLGYDILAFLNG